MMAKKQERIETEVGTCPSPVKQDYMCTTSWNHTQIGLLLTPIRKSHKTPLTVDSLLLEYFLTISYQYFDLLHCFRLAVKVSVQIQGNLKVRD